MDFSRDFFKSKGNVNWYEIRAINLFENKRQPWFQLKPFLIYSFKKKIWFVDASHFNTVLTADAPLVPLIGFSIFVRRVRYAESPTSCFCFCTSGMSSSKVYQHWASLHLSDVLRDHKYSHVDVLNINWFKLFLNRIMKGEHSSHIKYM